MYGLWPKDSQKVAVSIPLCATIFPNIACWNTVLQLETQSQNDSSVKIVAWDKLRFFLRCLNCPGAALNSSHFQNVQLETAKGSMVGLRSIDNYEKQNVKGLLLKKRSRSQTKVPMEWTHQGLSTSDVWKSYWPWSRYNEFKRQLHIWPWNLEPSRSRSQTMITMESLSTCTSEVWKSYWL